MASRTYKAWSVVTTSTTAFTVCFMVWMMFAVIGIPIKESLGLNETQFGILVAMPVLTGSLIRLPLGMWTDRYGGRIVFFILMLSTVFPIWLISRATDQWMGLLIWWKPFKQEDVATLTGLIAAGKVQPRIDRLFPLDDAVEALRWVDEGKAMGKVVITVP